MAISVHLWLYMGICAHMPRYDHALELTVSHHKRMEILIIIFASIIFRKVNGKPIFQPDVEDTIYEDKWISGYSFNIFQVIGGARNCLWIKITQEDVKIGPHFPFSLFFLPEIWGCEWQFKKRDLVKIEESAVGVAISYKCNGKEKEFKVLPSDTKKFIGAASG